MAETVVVAVVSDAVEVAPCAGPAAVACSEVGWLTAA